MSNGSYDIDYHYVIDTDGNIYEGRNIGYRGAHVSRFAGNTGAVGVLWLGLSESTGNTPTNQQYTATIGLVYALDTNYGISNVYSHRGIEMSNNGPSTICPGDAALPFIDAIMRFFTR
jgi:hypothetical protein